MSGKWDDNWQEPGQGARPPHPIPAGDTPPPAWSGAHGDPPPGVDGRDPLPEYIVLNPVPEHWSGEPPAFQRVDGVTVTLGVAEYVVVEGSPTQGAEAAVGWWVQLPLVPGGGDFERVFIEVPTGVLALRVVDTCWPPPGYIRVPVGWLVDVRRMRATRLELVRPLVVEDWRPGMRTREGLEVAEAGLSSDVDVLMLRPPGVSLEHGFHTSCVVLGAEAPMTLEPDLTHLFTVATLMEADLVRRVDVAPHEPAQPGDGP